MEKKKAQPVVADINVTPMVDVMLVLLIIFMVITPMLTKGTTVDMVRTHHDITMQAADKEDAVLIAVTRNGALFLSPAISRSPPISFLKKCGIFSLTRPTRWSISGPMPAPSIPWSKTWSTMFARPAWTRSA
jgi:hypothetical protein